MTLTLEKKPWLPPTILLALTLAAFFPLLLSGTFFWDDYTLILDNPLIKSPTGLWDIWFSTKAPDYFPLTSTTFWIEWRLWGNSPQFYHLANILLHAGSAMMLYPICRLLKIPGAFLIALLFAVHPVNAESVAWIAERKNTLSMFCMCASLLCYLRFEISLRRGFYLAAVICFLLALLAKPAVVMLPFVLLILAWYQRRRIHLGDLIRAAPFFALSLLLGLFTVYFQYHNSISDVVVRNDSMLSRFAVAACAFWFYLGKVLLPANICFNYPRWDIPFTGMIAFLPLALLIAAIGILIILALRGKCRFIAAPIAAYVLMLLPILGFLNIFFMRYSLVSDHWQYQADPAVITLVVGSLTALYWRGRRPVRIALAAVAVFITGVFGIYTCTIADTYRSAETIWLDTVAHNPQSWLAHANLGEMYLNQARQNPAKLPLAIEHLSWVVALQPTQCVAYANLGNAYALANRPDAALASYTSAIAAPNGAKAERSLAHYGLGTLYARAGNFPQAESEVQAALRIFPGRVDTYAPTFLALAQIELRANHPDRAAELIRDVLAHAPQNTAAKSLLEQLTSPPATEK